MTAPTESSTPIARSELRPNLVVIHGWGGTFADAVRSLDQLASVECAWRPGEFLTPVRPGRLIRQVLSTAERGTYLTACRKLIVSRFLAASLEQAPLPKSAQADRQLTRFGERRLAAEHPELGLSLWPALRARRAAELRREALDTLGPLLPRLEALARNLDGHDGRAATEAEARDAIRGETAAAGDAGALPDFLEWLRQGFETGGDLDTVAAATLYAHALAAKARASGHTPTYGTDYRFVFLNYHDRLSPLSAHGPANVYMADLPIGAFPYFESDARELATRSVHIARFEDHHPYSAEQRAMLEQLTREGLIGSLRLSGHLSGEELPPETALTCGADLAYEGMVTGTPADTPGARALRSAAHAEDFVTDRSAFSRRLTALIKGGACKAELAQALVESIPGDDAAARLQAHGWSISDPPGEAISEDTRAELLSRVAAVHIRRKDGAAGGRALGGGSDAPVAPPPRSVMSREPCRVLVALAPQVRTGEPRVQVGQAAEFLAEAFPDADYLFYCYGADLLVARRLNAADYTLNLGQLMPFIGTDADGGHGGAAVCRPESNPAFPARLFRRVNADNLVGYATYLAARLAAAGHVAQTVRRVGRAATHRAGRDAGYLAAVLLFAIAAGLLLCLVRPGYRPAQIRESNAEFLSFLNGGTELEDGEEPSAP